MHPAEGVSFGFSLLLLLGIVPLGTLGYLVIPRFGEQSGAENARAGNVHFSWVWLSLFKHMCTGGDAVNSSFFKIVIAVDTAENGLHHLQYRFCNEYCVYSLKNPC